VSDFLFEIGTEEIPASYLAPALEQMAEKLRTALEAARLPCGDVYTTATPRRLMLFAREIPARQEDLTEEVTGPPARVARDGDGHWTKAALGFARKQGVEPEQLGTKQTEKGEYLVAVVKREGRPTSAILSDILPELIRTIRFPKSMRWRASDLTFARPIRTLLALLDRDVVPFEFNGVAGGRTTQGHPFLAPGEITVPAADLNAYRELLRTAHVIVDIAERSGRLEEKMTELYAPHGSSLHERDLLETVTQLLEYPNVLEGAFDERFLDLPAEILETVMIHHQTYFPVRGPDGKLRPRFLCVLNRTDEHMDLIREGNERILRGRLEDAEFFWQEDAKASLAERVDGLKGVMFHAQAGSLFDKVQRVKALVNALAESLGVNEDVRAHAVRAAELCKADLLTEMVNEFPELQGVVGRVYAQRDGEPPEVAQAIEEHYMPRAAGADMPQTETGSLLSLAEKFDSIVTGFCVGLAPTGSQDPYALRRQCNGILRLLLDRGIRLNLSPVMAVAAKLAPPGVPQADGACERVAAFFRDRLYHLFLDQGYRYDLVNAVLASGFDDVLDVKERVQALQQLSQEANWESLARVVERTHNICKNVDVTGAVQPDRLVEKEEKALWQVLAQNRAAITAAIEQRDYVKASQLFRDLFGQPVHDFFDQVFVNVEDESLRENRLRLCQAVNHLYSTAIADLSEVILDA